MSLTSGMGRSRAPRTQTVSVLIPAYRASSTLAACVSSVLGQDPLPPDEVVVVVSGEPQPRDLPPNDRVILRWTPERIEAATARNLCVSESSGDLLVFTDADVVAPRGWLAALVEASDGGAHIVAGGVRNGTPSSGWGTAEHLVQFSELDPAWGRNPSHGATCNLLVPRALWEQYGPFTEDLGGGEDTLLTLAARRDGHLRHELRAAVVHRNRTRARDVLAHQREFGRFTARLIRCSADIPHRWVHRPALVPLAVALRCVNVLRRAARTSPPRGWIRTTPAVVALLAAWGIGLAEEGLRLWKTRQRCFPPS